MPTQTIATAATWTGGNSFAADAAGTDVLVQNTSPEQVFFALTDATTPPALGVVEAHVLLPNRYLPMQLKPNEKIWFAAKSAGKVVVSY